jgi:glutamate-5-semialdehyde dehydrogenase
MNKTPAFGIWIITDLICANPFNPCDKKNMNEELQKVQAASRSLVNFGEEKMNEVLLDLAKTIPEYADAILAANKKDLDRMAKSDPKYDRLLLNKERLEGIASDIKNVATLEYPVGQVLEERVVDSGLDLKKISVPLGVVGIIYEARPNVTFDVFSLCFKSGNACILKGGSDAEESNKAIVKLIRDVLISHDIDASVLHLLPAEREAVKYLLDAVDYVDVIIPRGSQGLIGFVRNNSKVPVIETGAGIVHTYVDEQCDLEMAANIIFNAKTRRVSICNALDTLVIHEIQLDKLSNLVEKLTEHNVEIFADEKAYSALEGKYSGELLKRAKEQHFGTEFLNYKMSIKTVSSLTEAVEHITKYSSKHSEAIVSSSQENIDYFLTNVDAACVYANASTAFTDGAQFGLGAEIGISTQKLHARGPMALRELTSYKWVVRGSGQTRN